MKTSMSLSHESGSIKTKRRRICPLRVKIDMALVRSKQSDGFTIEEIAAELNVARSTIVRRLKRARTAAGEVGRRVCPPRVTVDISVVRSLQADGKLLADIAAELNVARSTIVRRLRLDHEAREKETEKEIDKIAQTAALSEKEIDKIAKTGAFCPSAIATIFEEIDSRCNDGVDFMNGLVTRDVPEGHAGIESFRAIQACLSRAKRAIALGEIELSQRELAARVKRMRRMMHGTR